MTSEVQFYDVKAWRGLGVMLIHGVLHSILYIGTRFRISM